MRHTSRQLLLAAGSAAVLASAVRADDLTVSTATTTPVATATAANNTPGNVTVNKAASIIVTGPTAVTINSSNVFTNNGTISSSATSNAVAVLFGAPGPITASLLGNSIISVTGTGGSGNIGLSVTGGPITGTIDLGTSSSIAVSGDNAFGVRIAAPFVGNVSLASVTVTGANSTAIAITAPITASTTAPGNLTLTGTSSSTGAGGYGLNVTAPIAGYVRNAGTLSAGTAQTTSGTTGLLVNGVVPLAAARISSNVGGGFLNDQYYVDATGAVVPTGSVVPTNTLVTGTIASVGSGPGLWIAPTGTTPAPITLGIYSAKPNAAGVLDDAYGIINRGNISANYAVPGQEVTAIIVGGGGAATNVAGGFNSQLGSGISATAVDSTATALSVRAGANVPAILNQGSLSSLTAQTAAVGTTAAGIGGSAYGIVVDKGANVATINNVGLMTITSRGTGNSAYGIVDHSSTVTNIVNSGTINIIAPIDSKTFARAIDLTGSTAAVTVANSNIISGDIAFGNGPSTLALTGGVIAGTVAFGTGANTLALSSNAIFNTALTSAAPVAFVLSGSSRLSLANSTATVGSVAANGSSTLVLPVRQGTAALNVVGAASFTQTSSIQLSLQSLADTQSLTVLQAAGGITTDHLGTLINPLNSPYLYTLSSPTLTANTLSILLNRKTADQIGLTGNQAALFNASFAGLPSGSPESAAIANLPSQAAVIAAYAQILPPSAGRAQFRAAQNLIDNGFGAAGQRLSEIEQLRHGRVRGLGAWVQEFGDFARQRTGPNEVGFRNNGFGFAGGVDMPLLGLDAAGIAIVSQFMTTRRYTGGGQPTYNVTSTTVGVEPYASWSRGPLFAQLTGLFAHTDYTAKRTIAIGGITDAVGADWGGTQYGAGLTVGARLKRGRLRITPTNALTWTSLNQGGYTETGGGAFDLKVAHQKQSATADTGRLALGYLVPFGDSTLEFELHGAYQHQFQADPTKSLAQYVNGGDWVTLLGDHVDSDKLLYGARVGYLQENVSLKVDYDRAQSSGYQDNAVSLTAGMVF